MTATELSTSLTDPELISLVRDGDVAAYGTLFSRHVDAANRLAQMLTPGPDADDLVSEAFIKVLNVLLAGGGPDVAFRAYLLTAVRRLHVDKVRVTQKATPTGDLTPFDPGVPFTDTAVAGFEGGAAAKAFASLPERWQLVLWHLEVENQKPADVAPLLGMTPNSVSALAYRAREGLRQAFLTMHTGETDEDRCRQTLDQLGGYVRKALSRRDRTAVQEHLDHCRKCTGVYLELTEVNHSLAELLGPIVLGAAAAAYVSSSVGVGGGAGGLLTLLLGRGKDLVLANAPASAATAGVASIAAVTAIAVGVTPHQPLASDPPRTVVTGPLAKQEAPTRPPGPGSVTLAPQVRVAKTRPTPTPTPTTLAAPTPLEATAEATPLPTPTPEEQPGPDEQTPDPTPDQPDPTPDPPDPTPDPPDPTPDPPDPTPDPPDPTPDPPKHHQAEISVHASPAGSDAQGNRLVTATVTGVQKGGHAVLFVKAGKLRPRVVSGNACSKDGTRLRCVARPGRDTFTFSIPAAPGETTVALTLKAPWGWRDSTPDDNFASVQLPGTQP